MPVRTVSIILLTTFAVVTVPAAPRKAWLPLEEIKRPLWRPPGNIELNFGWVAGLGQRGKEFNFDFDLGLTSLGIPYFQLGPRAELHLLSPILVLNAIKHVAIIDSIAYCTGMNLDLVAGITGISYSARGGFDMDYGGGFSLKAPASERVWLTHGAMGEIDLNRRWDIGGHLGVGFQLTTHMALIARSRIDRYVIVVYYTNEKREEHYLESSWSFTTDLKINRNKRRSLMLRTGYAYRINTWEHKDIWSILLGAQTTWYW